MKSLGTGRRFETYQLVDLADSALPFEFRFAEIVDPLEPSRRATDPLDTA
jgi:hypothetical protein